MTGILLPKRAAGFLMGKELESFAKAIEKPAKPFVVVMGGAKVKDKIQIITKMLDYVDEMIFGGGIAYTFKKVVDNMTIGKSLFDEEGAKAVPEIIKKAKEKNVKLNFSCDYVGPKGDKDTQIFTEEKGIPADD